MSEFFERMRRSARRFQVDPNDTRTPMHRLLEDGQGGHPGHIEVFYEAQFKTLRKAERLGYVDDRANLLPAGYVYLARATGNVGTFDPEDPDIRRNPPAMDPHIRAEPTRRAWPVGKWSVGQERSAPATLCGATVTDKDYARLADVKDWPVCPACAEIAGASDIRRNPMKVWRDFGNGYYVTKDEPGRWTVHGQRHHLKIQQSEGPTGREDRYGNDYLQTIYVVESPRGGRDPVVGDLSEQFEESPDNHGFTRLIDAAEWAAEQLVKAGA